MTHSGIRRDLSGAAGPLCLDHFLDRRERGLGMSHQHQQPGIERSVYRLLGKCDKDLTPEN